MCFLVRCPAHSCILLSHNVISPFVIMPLSKPRNTSGYGPSRERKNRSHKNDHDSSRRKPFLEYVKLGPDFGHEMRLSRLPREVTLPPTSNSRTDSFHSSSSSSPPTRQEIQKLQQTHKPNSRNSPRRRKQKRQPRSFNSC